MAVGLVAASAFLPGLANGWVEWDDRENYLENPMYRGLGAANLCWMLASDHVGVYQPVGWMASAAQYLAFGMDARGYHATAVAAHALDAALAYLLIRALARRARPALGRRAAEVGAFWGACLWGVHPLRVEVFAWASAQHYTFCAGFGLLCVLAYLKARPEGSPTHRGWLAASVSLLVAALASKAAAAGIVGSLAVLDVYPLRRRGEIGRALREKLWFLLPTAAFALAAVRAKAANGSLAAAEASGLGGRAAQSCYGLMFYLVKTFWPADLCIFYPLPERVDWRIWPFSASLAAASALVVVAALNRRRSPGPAASRAAYLSLALPMIGLVRVGAWCLGGGSRPSGSPRSSGSRGSRGRSRGPGATRGAWPGRPSTPGAVAAPRSSAPRRWPTPRRATSTGPPPATGARWSWSRPRRAPTTAWACRGWPRVGPPRSWPSSPPPPACTPSWPSPRTTGARPRAASAGSPRPPKPSPAPWPPTRATARPSTTSSANEALGGRR